MKMKPSRPPARAVNVTTSRSGVSPFTCFILFVSFATLVSTVNCVLTNVLALIEENSSLDDITSIIRMSEMSFRSLNVSIVTISRRDSSFISFNYACSNITQHQASILLSFLDSDLSYLANTLSSSTQLPLLSIQLASSNAINAYDEMSMGAPLKVSLDPSLARLTDATLHLLKQLEIKSTHVIIDDSPISTLIKYYFTHSQKFMNNCLRSLNVKFLRITRFMSPSRMLKSLLQITAKSSSSVIVHIYDRQVILQLIQSAYALKLTHNSLWPVWIYLDTGIIKNDSVNQIFPSNNNASLNSTILLIRRQKNSPDDILTYTKNLFRLIHVASSSNVVNEKYFGEKVTPKYVSCENLSHSNATKNSSPFKSRIFNLLNAARRQTKINCSAKAATPSPSPSSSSSSSSSNNRGETLPETNILTWPSEKFQLMQLNKSQKWHEIGLIDDSIKLNINFHLKSREENSDSSTLTFFSPVTTSEYRIVTAIAPPFIQETTKLGNSTYPCLSGVPCLKVSTGNASYLSSIFEDYSSARANEGLDYNVTCCAGVSIDLLVAISRDMNFTYGLYLVSDGYFGVSKEKGHWDGIVNELRSGGAHMAFTAFSVTSSRIQVIDFSVPYFYSGVSCLSYTRITNDSIPLLGFLVPFSPHLWICIFVSLVITAFAAAMYEWLSPFGLNPWGRQRTKNFTLASALWVMTSLLFSHLVAFKAPKSWPNKVLINLWAGFSVIFLATYTANIAAHFAGLFTGLEVKKLSDSILMSLRTGVVKSSASQGYIMKENAGLWNQVQKNRVNSFEDGFAKLRSRELDVLIGDTAILDYFRTHDPDCNLNFLGNSIFDDAYAIGMQKGFPLKEKISELILRYNSYGFMDQLLQKWFSKLQCMDDSWDNLNKPSPLGVKALSGLFILLGCGLIVGIILLFFEHAFYKYLLPQLRNKPREDFWRSRRVMFFSQKLYRFINTFELVSPHHSAKEIMENLKEGQITSLFQKSLKRKAKEEARRRRSKSQFFEMMQEVRNAVHQRRLERKSSALTASLKYDQPKQFQQTMSAIVEEVEEPYPQLTPAATVDENSIKIEPSQGSALTKSIPHCNIDAVTYLNSDPEVTKNKKFKWKKSKSQLNYSRNKSLSNFNRNNFKFSFDDTAITCTKDSSLLLTVKKAHKSFDDLEIISGRKRTNNKSSINVIDSTYNYNVREADSTSFYCSYNDIELIDCLFEIIKRKKALEMHINSLKKRIMNRK